MSYLQIQKRISGGRVFRGLQLAIVTIYGNFVTSHGNYSGYRMAITVVDTDSGVELEGRLALIPAKKTNGFQDGWVAMSQNAMNVILQMKCAGEIDGRDLDVLLHLTTVLDFENHILVSQADIARRLKMKPPHVSRSMKQLAVKGLIVEGAKTGRSKTYRLNPNVGWKGTGKNHKKAISSLKLVHNADRDPNTFDMWDN